MTLDLPTVVIRTRFPSAQKLRLGIKGLICRFAFQRHWDGNSWRAGLTRYHFRYGVNLSNKVPTVRIILGIELQGAF